MGNFLDTQSLSQYIHLAQKRVLMNLIQAPTDWFAHEAQRWSVAADLSACAGSGVHDE
jgi:hypothetical protein